MMPCIQKIGGGEAPRSGTAYARMNHFAPRCFSGDAGYAAPLNIKGIGDVTTVAGSTCGIRTADLTASNDGGSVAQSHYHVAAARLFAPPEHGFEPCTARRGRDTHGIRVIYGVSGAEWLPGIRSRPLPRPVGPACAVRPRQLVRSRALTSGHLDLEVDALVPGAYLGHRLSHRPSSRPTNRAKTIKSIRYNRRRTRNPSPGTCRGSISKYTALGKVGSRFPIHSIGNINISREGDMNIQDLQIAGPKAAKVRQIGSTTVGHEPLGALASHGLLGYASLRVNPGRY